ncbi:MAG TPA: putative beta-lysine N-acetyltransferase [Phycisphaerales bacterium]|nr:putative beta-lysine N-acetyltransferase [Phycisphaerales bacterium]
MFDTIEKIDHSLVQHGPVSDRIYLMKLSGQDLPDLLGKLDALAEQRDYSKIFAKAPLQVKGLFEAHDYVEEAVVPCFYNGDTDGVFLAKYIDPQRELDPAQKKIEHIIDLAETKAALSETDHAAIPLTIRPAEEDDVEALAEVYQQVFESYPFPIHEPDYLRETMASHVQYFGAFDQERLVAAGSAEMDVPAQNAEMTDFATLPEYRGRGLAQQLLDTMEQHMRDRGIKTGYTIARALSAGMNITFAKHGYQFAGTLTNNTNICGRIESMNVWYKSLTDN